MIIYGDRTSGKRITSKAITLVGAALPRKVAVRAAAATVVRPPVGPAYGLAPDRFVGAAEVRCVGPS